MDLAFRWFKYYFFLLCFSLSVFLGGFLYLNSRLEAREISQKTESVPYYSPKPDNSAVLFDISGDLVLFYLNFQDESMNIVFPTVQVGQLNTYGFNVDETVKTDYRLVSYFTDLVGGIDLEIDGQSFRYTGVQTAELLEYSADSTIKREILEKIVAGIADVGFFKEDMLYIAEKCECSFSFSDVYYWTEYIQKLCKFKRFIN